MEDSVEEFHIYATNILKTARTRILKDGQMFGAYSVAGDIDRWGNRVTGLYLDDMRHLSQFDVRVAGQRPILLNSTVTENNLVLTADLTNSATQVDATKLPSDTLHIFRRKILYRETCYECFSLRNYHWAEIPAVELEFRFEADFHDIFEIRGLERSERGTVQEPEVEDRSVEFLYRGLDDCLRTTRLTFSAEPEALSEGLARFEFCVPPHEAVTLDVTIECSNRPADQPTAETDARRDDPPRFFADAHAELSENRRAEAADRCTIRSSNALFDQWMARSSADLSMLSVSTPWGPYPQAGTPWFNAFFGRDGLLTAYQVLNVRPEIARGVLGFLANSQATEEDDVRDAEPGKILHEARRSETANIGEVPFGRYYGSIDATPLFVWLAGEYLRRTDDTEFIAELWPSIKAAIDWIDDYGDIDDDGFVEYTRRSPKGLVNQGWKDSHDSVFHADGRAAQGPVALCEVQAYVYGARRAAATIARAVGDPEFAQTQIDAADALREAFEATFWSDALDSYVLALDGDNEPCAVRTSNPGHCLLFEIASADHAARLTDTLNGPEMYSEWGIRTLGADEPRFNPLSYHNGSVWPHDNALIARGFANYDFRYQALQLFEAMFEAASSFDLHRLPELFCGFQRRTGEGPTPYPVACSPQAWSAGSVFLLLDALLDLRIDARRKVVEFDTPILPSSVDQLRIENLRVDDGTVDLVLRRYGDDVGVEVLRRDGPVEVRVIK